MMQFNLLGRVGKCAKERCRNPARAGRTKCGRCAASSAEWQKRMSGERKLRHKAQIKAWSEANQEKRRRSSFASRMWTKYGLSVDQYDELLFLQDGKCAICRHTCRTGNRLAVDHCHETGKVRGLLCLCCNTALGKFGDDPDKLEAAASYLRKHGDK